MTALLGILLPIAISVFLMGCTLEDGGNGGNGEEKVNLELVDLDPEISGETVGVTFSVKAEGQVEKSVEIGIQVKKGTNDSWVKEVTLGADSMNKLNDGQTVFVTTSITLPDWGPGQYTISVVVDKPDEIDEEDETDNALEASVELEIQLPAAPSNLIRTNTLPCAIEWDDNSDNEEGFNIYFGASCGDVDMVKSWTQVISVGKDVTSYAWTKSCCSVAECSWAMVRAFNEKGESEDSNAVRLAPLC
jgi:hypothetical protein